MNEALVLELARAGLVKKLRAAGCDASLGEALDEVYVMMTEGGIEYQVVLACKVTDSLVAS